MHTHKSEKKKRGKKHQKIIKQENSRSPQSFYTLNNSQWTNQKKERDFLKNLFNGFFKLEFLNFSKPLNFIILIK